MISVEVQSEETERLFAELSRRMSDTGPVLDAIGQILVSSTQLRFVDEESPDHVPWQPLSSVTLARRRKKGGGAKILRDTGRLASSITYVAGDGSVSVGTNVDYANVHQYGQRKGASGRTKRNSPIPWGDIPARPFLGINDDDLKSIDELLESYLDASQPESWWRRLLNGIRRWF